MSSFYALQLIINNRSVRYTSYIIVPCAMPD